MSAPVEPARVSAELDVVDPGDEAGAHDAWRLKERIRAESGVFQQGRSFFMRTYRRARIYRLHDGDTLVGFAAVRGDGYLLLLAVERTYRGSGLGRRMVDAALGDHDRLTCHVRATNEDAIGFYEHVGFETVRRVPGYYGDGSDALYLRLEAS